MSTLPTPTDEFSQQLASEMFSARQCGRVLVWSMNNQGEHPDQAANQIAQAAGLSPPQEWRALNREQAVEHLTTVIAYSLAYGRESCVPDSVATALVDRFLSGMPAGAAFRTNGDFNGKNSHLTSWAPLSSWTFDTGLIAVSDSLVRLCWVLEED